MNLELKEKLHNKRVIAFATTLLSLTFWGHYTEGGGFAYAKTEGVVGIVNLFTIPQYKILFNSTTNLNLLNCF